MLGAELLGDKTLYVTSILSLRSKLPPIICGFAAAVSAKMFVAIWIGSFIMKLPREALAIVSATTFFLMAFSLGRISESRSLTLKAIKHFERLDTPSLKAMCLVLLGRLALELGQVDRVVWS